MKTIRATISDHPSGQYLTCGDMCRTDQSKITSSHVQEKVAPSHPVISVRLVWMLLDVSKHNYFKSFYPEPPISNDDLPTLLNTLVCCL